MHAPCSLSPSPIRSHELNLYRRSTHKGVLWSNPRHYFCNHLHFRLSPAKSSRNWGKIVSMFQYCSELFDILQQVKYQHTQYWLWLMNKPSLVGALELISEWSTFLWHQKLYVTGVVWSLYLTHVDLFRTVEGDYLISDLPQGNIESLPLSYHTTHIKLICMLFLLTRSSTHHHLETSYHIENSSLQHF